MNPLVGLSIIERLVALFKSIFGKGKGNPPTPPPNATTGDPVAPAAPSRRHRYVPLALCVILTMPGCSTIAKYIGPAFQAETLEQLRDLCDSAVPCPDCPGTPVPSPVPPAPTPPVVNPVPAPDAGVVDAIPVSSIVWLHDSPAAFPLTATLSDVRVTLPQTISWRWTAPADWPEDGNGVIGNMWVCAKIDGRVNCATWEWLRRTTTAKATEANPGEPVMIQTKVAPLNAWVPRSGEEVWWLVSSPCRAGCKGVKGRSAIIAGVWP